ncbi:MAG: hypothetical protein ACT4N1_07235 [Nitrososphaerota archaeon]
MSASKAKKTRTKKATKADLEAKITELEAKLGTLSAQVSKPTPPPPKPAETRAPPPTPEPEVAPAYSTTSSTKYTGNKYYATRQRLAYHPPDKQFSGGQVAQTVQVQPPPEPAPEPQEEPKKEKPKRMEAPAPKVNYYTGENYYRTRQRLAYHPPDKQFIEPKAIKFEEAPTAAQVEEATSSQDESKAAKDKKSRANKLAEYEREYLERLERQRVEEATKPAPAPAKQRGTMPSGWK